MTTEDFEHELESVTVEIEVPTSQADGDPPAIEPEVIDEGSTRISSLAADQLVYNKTVARALCNGMSISEVAKRLGVSDAVVRTRVNTFQMADLLEIEARRVVRHLSDRKLENEKYLGLSTAVCGMIDKIRLLRDEPTDITEHTVSQGTIDRIKAGLFGRRNGEVGKGSGGEHTPLAGSDAQAVHEIAASGPEAGS